MKRLPPLLVPCIGLSLALAFSSGAYAELFKCKGDDGKIAYQETPCAKGDQKTLRPDAPSSPGGSSSGAGRVTGTDKDKRYSLDRQASKDTLAACIQMMRPDLHDVFNTFQVTSQMYKRIWQMEANTAERVIVTVTLTEKNKLEGAKQASFTCVLRGDESVDATATQQFPQGR